MKSFIQDLKFTKKSYSFGSTTDQSEMKTDQEITQPQQVPNFRFKALKVYTSTEWLAGNAKKYRQVFDRDETAYIYVELSFYNKLFDIAKWSADIVLKCFSVRENNKEICTISVSKSVQKYDSITYVREGWGNKETGTFWKKGAYYWEAFIDDKKVGTKYFYIEEHGNMDRFGAEAYAQLETLKLYESDHGDIIEEERIYLTEFSADQTSYIYAELQLTNQNREYAWRCEIIFRYYTHTRELKGQASKLAKINKGDEYIKLTSGWGTTSKGTWCTGRYVLEVIFMDELIATVPFTVGDHDMPGQVKVWVPGKDQPVLLAEKFPEKSFDEVMQDLEGMIGLHQLKRQILDHATYIQFLKIREQKGFSEKDSMSLHAIYTGNPGTGKTTVASKMGMIYKQMGLLSKGHVHQVDRVDLVGEFIGQTAPKVKEAIKKAKGGVLFIDEAYALARMNDDTKDFGREALEILVKEMGSSHDDLVVIAAGYPKEMEHFIKSNPGLKSRFKHFYHFPDYLPQELISIASYAAEKKEVELSNEAKMDLAKLITDAFRNRDSSFGNARFVNDLLEKAKINMGLRLMEQGNVNLLEAEQIKRIEKEDVQRISLTPGFAEPNIPLDQELLDDAMKELNSLIGLEKVKSAIRDLVDVVAFYRRSGKSVLNNFFLHTVFVGHPGTGKTTVARILTKIYKSLGILEKGHMVETDRQGLVGQYLGQTAVKTSEKVDEALGGVLFIDEAYALTSTSTQDYGKEAVQTILKRMEDKRGKFYVFVAGYPEQMQTFLKSNPGLSSRFDRILEFDDYSASEMMAIALQMISDQALKLSKKAHQKLLMLLNELDTSRDKYFGNARVVRKIVDDIIRHQRLRVARTEEGKRDLDVNSVLEEDVMVSDLNPAIFNQVRIGFRKRGKS